MHILSRLNVAVLVLVEKLEALVGDRPQDLGGDDLVQVLRHGGGFVGSRLRGTVFGWRSTHGAGPASSRTDSIGRGTDDACTVCR